MRVDTGSGSTIQYLCKYSKGRTGPSLRLQMSLKWKERQVFGKEEPPFRETLTAWEIGPTRIARGLTKINMKSCTWNGKILSGRTGWGLTGCKGPGASGGQQA